LPALLLASAFGCVQTQATLLNPTLTLRPSCPEAVLVFLSADRVGRPFVEVALLNSTGDNSLTSESGMHNSQRQKAAELVKDIRVVFRVQDHLVLVLPADIDQRLAERRERRQGCQSAVDVHPAIVINRPNCHLHPLVRLGEVERGSVDCSPVRRERLVSLQAA
jgi:hypothetical protein